MIDIDKESTNRDAVVDINEEGTKRAIQDEIFWCVLFVTDIILVDEKRVGETPS